MFKMADKFFELEAICNDDNDESEEWMTPSTEQLASQEANEIPPTVQDADAEHASGASSPYGSATPTTTVATSSQTNATTTSRRAFRLHARRLALTFPQNATTKDVAMARILAKWSGDIKWTVVTQESHQDGNPHLHIAIVFTKKKDFKRSAFADFIANAHGNYQAMKNELDWLKYITKNDTHPVLHKIDVEVVHFLYFIDRLSDVMTD